MTDPSTSSTILSVLEDQEPDETMSVGGIVDAGLYCSTDFYRRIPAKLEPLPNDDL